MKVAMLQMQIVNNDIETNEKTFFRLTEEAAQSKPDAMVLPELWSTGFYPQPPREAAKFADKWQNMLSDVAQKYNSYVIGGSIITERGERAYNTSFCFDRSGNLAAAYDKIHLFSPGGEHRDFAAGDAFRLFKLDDVICGTAICYDLRFPELLRYMTKCGAKIIFLPAQWPKARVNHWRILNQARAIENQIYLIAVNGVGQFANGKPLAGSSLAVDPWGEVAAKAGEAETVVVADLDVAAVQRVRKKLNVWADVREKLLPGSRSPREAKHKPSPNGSRPHKAGRHEN